MLRTSASFPHVGSFCYFDDQNDDGQDVVEKARIQRNNGDGTALISIESRRFPGEVASGNRTIDLDRLRETEQPVSQSVVTPARRRRARR